MMSDLSCFKAYDIRGEIDVNINEDIVYRISRAISQHLAAKSVIIGFDARETSPAFAKAASKGVRDTGADVINIGMAGTEEMYWAVTEFKTCAGIEVTASHNPINYNGLKVVKSQSQPLDDTQDFQIIKSLAESQKWLEVTELGQELNRIDEARKAYVTRILRFMNISVLKPMKIVVNSGNGAAGPTFDAIEERLKELGVPLEFIRINHTPDPTFPNGIPNPLLPQNHKVTAEVVIAEEADFGVAFDGDFDRCFFFDEAGKFVPSEYIVGILASIFLDKEAGAKIIHDPRVIWNTQDIVAKKGGLAVQSKTGHSFIKKVMRIEKAVYGGEMSAHHYFRDFAYCDSGMIPWILVAELVSRTGCSLGNWVKDRYAAFPSSGEINFRVDDAGGSIDKLLQAFRTEAISIDEKDGLTLVFKDWRLNLRHSNTEPLVRLNLEARGQSVKLENKVNAIINLLGGTIT